MLMECYECGKQISTRAERCTDCGFPVEETDFTKYCNVNGVLYIFSQILNRLSKKEEIPSDELREQVAALVANKTNMQWDECQQLAKIICDSNHLPESYEGKIDTVIKILKDKMKNGRS